MPSLPTPVVKRIERANGRQSRGTPCLICKSNFDDCPHGLDQIETLLQIYRQEKLLQGLR